MSIIEILADETADWERESPANPEAVQQLVDEAPIELPGEYLELLRYSNGGEGNLAVEPGWFQIWPAENVIEFNKGYEVQKNVPGLLGFGSSGGEEMLAFDTRGGAPYGIVMIPFIPMKEKHATLIAPNFEDFAAAMGHEPEGS